MSEDLERCPVRCKYGPSVSVLGVDTFNLDGVAQFSGKHSGRSSGVYQGDGSQSYHAVALLGRK